MAARYGLGRLASSNEFPELQRKLDNLYDNYNYNTSLSNFYKCSEIIEQNENVQRKLVDSLADISLESPRCLYRSRLWPYKYYDSYYYPYYYNYYYYPYSVALSSDLALRKTINRKNAEISDLSYKYEKELTELESDLTNAKLDNNDLKTELEIAKDELHNERSRSLSRNIASQADIAALKAKLSSAEFKLSTLEPKAELASHLELEIANLKDEIRRVRVKNEILADHNELQAELIKSRSCSPVYICSRPVSPLFVRSRPVSPVRIRSRPVSRACSPCPRLLAPSDSPLSPNNCTQVIRQESLVTRFSDLYTRDRLNAMDILRNFSDDYENNQRIIFAAVQESFSTAKRLFAEWKIRVRSSIAITHVGPETLEEAVQNYVNRNVDLYDLPCMTSEVILALTRNPKLDLPAGVSFSIISSFIREACRLAWEMSSLAYPIDTALALDAEVLDETKYRRTYDSEYSAPLVNHHVWPCLMQGTRVLSRGEACTKRGASAFRSRSRSRNSSPLRSCLRNRSSSSYRRSKSSYSIY